MPIISFDPIDYDILEGTTGKVTLVTDQPPLVETAIELTTLMETTVSDDDYELSTDTVVFKPGQSTASFVVSIIDDSVVQSDRELHLSFVPLDDNSTPGEVSVAVITIEDNEPEIGFVVPGSFQFVGEGGVAQIQFNASRLTTAPLTVNLLYTMDGGAITGVHSSAEVFTTITVDTHITTRHTIEIVIIDDEIVEEGVFRRVDIVLQEGAGYTVDPDNAISILAVLDNDGPLRMCIFHRTRARSPKVRTLNL